MTYTVVRLPLSQAAFDEIKTKLLAADYQHTFITPTSIDMTHIAVEPESGEDADA